MGTARGLKSWPVRSGQYGAEARGTRPATTREPRHLPRRARTESSVAAPSRADCDARLVHTRYAYANAASQRATCDKPDRPSSPRDLGRADEARLRPRCPRVPELQTPPPRDRAHHRPTRDPPHLALPRPRPGPTPARPSPVRLRALLIRPRYYSLVRPRSVLAMI